MNRQRYLAAALFVLATSSTTSAEWVDPVPPSVRAYYEQRQSFWPGIDGWMQEHDSPHGCSSKNSCAANGCDTHRTRFAWADPRKEPWWPADLLDCECGGVGAEDDPRWVMCRYSE